MKLTTGLKLATVLFLAIASVFVWDTNKHAVAAAQSSNQSQTKKTSSNSNTTKSVVYSYVAQPGDSYTLLARKAIQTYGLIHKTKITEAGIIFAETNLTQQAGSPALNEGETVKISESTVKPWVDKAQKLSKSEQAAWGYYVQFVDFNTSHVGQAK